MEIIELYILNPECIDYCYIYIHTPIYISITSSLYKHT